MGNQEERVAAAAKQYFTAGFSCAEATFLAGRNELLPDSEVPSSIAGCFGGGVARTGSVCGALSGVFMLVGLIYNRVLAEEKELALKAYETAQSIYKDFAARFGTVNCRDLTGYDLPEQYSDFAADKAARLKCHEYVDYAARLLVRELEKRQKI
ncbi:MAG: C_GCAxxG_C_C family protein [Firmicutes bacterium]|nr:C_GCAxxG_C_C family protein [Bacillota bacterium]